MDKPGEYLGTALGNSDPLLLVGVVRLAPSRCWAIPSQNENRLRKGSGIVASIGQLGCRTTAKGLKTVSCQNVGCAHSVGVISEVLPVQNVGIPKQ